MDYLYSLYDALVSINVPNDRARAVVDAMERDMGTTLATKSDIGELRIATKADLAELRSANKADVAELRHEVALIRKDLQLLETSMTVRLGSMLVVVAGVLFAALKLT